MFLRSVKTSTSIAAKIVLADADSFLLNTANVSASTDPEMIINHRKRLDEHIDKLQRASDALTSELSSWFSIVCAVLMFRRKNQHKKIRSCLAAICQTIRALNSQRGSISPIARLPSEVLSHVFAYCAAAAHCPFRRSTTGLGSPISQPSQLSSQSIAWVKVTHVCRLWRFIALSNPTLWTHICTIPPQWAMEMLSRSQSLPLFVKADFLTFKGVATSNIVLNQLLRIQELTLIIPDLEILKEGLTQPAPLLDSFALRLYHKSSDVPLPNYIFSPTAPHLRRLSLDNCSLPWDSPLFGGLTHFRLANVAIDIPLSQFLAILGGIPNLRELSLREAMPNSPRDVVASPTSCSLTTLHQLSWLCLNGPSIKCVNFLNNVHLPKRPVLWLGFEVGSWSADPLHWIISAATQHCGVHDDETALRGLSIETIFGGGLRVQAWSTTDIFHPDAHCRLTLRLTSRSPGWFLKTTPHAVAGVCSLFPLQHVRTLHLGNLNLTSLWIDARQYLDRVEKIFLDGDSVHGLILALDKDALQNTKSENPAAGLLPALHTLICRHASFGQESTKMTHMGRLLAILDHRRGLGSGIKSLHLCECHGFTEQDMGLLKVIVPEVVCVDGHDGGGYQCLRCSRG